MELKQKARANSLVFFLNYGLKILVTSEKLVIE